jgi:hypothetical protein
MIVLRQDSLLSYAKGAGLALATLVFLATEMAFFEPSACFAGCLAWAISPAFRLGGIHDCQSLRGTFAREAMGRGRGSDRGKLYKMIAREENTTQQARWTT